MAVSVRSGVFVGISTAEAPRYSEFWVGVLGLRGVAEVRIAHGTNVAANRNVLTEAFLASGREWVFFADDDQVFRPDTVVRLVGHGVPVVSGLYVSRRVPFLGHVFAGERNAHGEALRLRLTGGHRGLVPVEATGAGALLVHRRVVEALEPPYWRLGQIQPEAWGDDIDLCRRVRAAGFEIVVDVETWVGHKRSVTLWPTRTAEGWGTSIVAEQWEIGRIPVPDA